jgi:hypothetical protein
VHAGDIPIIDVAADMMVKSVVVLYMICVVSYTLSLVPYCGTVLLKFV